MAGTTTTTLPPPTLNERRTMTVKMTMPYSDPNMVLHAGKSYDLPEALAKQLLAHDPAAAVLLTAAELSVLAALGTRVRKPTRPDPEDDTER